MKESEHENGRKSLDLTPMVDVTFLLLIYFMVTASFAVEPPTKQVTISHRITGR